MDDDTEKSADRGPLDSDQLGELGERLFATYCATQKLIANKADRDRAGWDFIVEFPFDHINPGPLAERSNPLSCMVQVKAMWESSDRISLRLSSVERLAKDSRPSFIYVMKIDKTSLEPVSAHLISMRGAVLGKVLRKLREEDAAKRVAVNRARMSLSAASDGQLLEVGGAALKEAIASAITPDQASFESAKQRELEVLGYEPAAGSMKLTLQVSGQKELVDVMLGISKPNIVRAASFSTRFGITLESQHPVDPRAISIEPLPSDQCKVVIRRDAYSEAVEFDADVYFPPPSVTETLAVRIVADMFEVQFDGYGFRFQSSVVKHDTPQLTVQAWRKFFLMTSALSEPDTVIEITPKSAKIGSIRHPLSNGMKSDNPDLLSDGLEISGMLLTLLNHTGTNERPTVTLSGMVSSGSM